MIPLLLLVAVLQGQPVRIQVGTVNVLAQPRQLPLAIGLAEQANRTFDWPGLGRRIPGPFRLVVVGDSLQLREVSRGLAPAWGAGVMLPGIRTIIVRTDLDSPEQTFRHELAHLALHDAVPTRVPLWFDEGYASWAAGEWDRLEILRLNLAVAGGTAPDLRELDGMLRGSAGTAGIAYALAVSAVLELARRNPTGTIGPLLTKLQAGEGFEPSVLATTGLTLGRFELEWQRDLRHRYNLLTWLLAGGFWARTKPGSPRTRKAPKTIGINWDRIILASFVNEAEMR